MREGVGQRDWVETKPDARRIAIDFVNRGQQRIEYGRPCGAVMLCHSPQGDR